MFLTDPDHYNGCIVMRNELACLRRELQRAHSEQKWTLHTATPTTRTANQTWPSPWQLPANTQVINPSTHDTIAVLSAGNNHSATHNCTTSPATAKRKAPPPTLTNTPESAPEPRATKNSVNHAPTTSPPEMDGWQVQDNKRTTDESRYLEEIRWAVTESMANLAPKRNATLENDNNIPFPSSPPNGVAPALTSVPAPSPDEPQDEDGITDAKGIAMHKDGWQYKVTVKCKNCPTQYTTRWGTNSDPYKELTNANWEQGRDRSGNWTWQKARCPNF